MEAGKHTQGPWKAVVNSADYWEVVHPWPEQSFDEANAYSPTVVHVCAKEGEEQEANARLIAAAPTYHDGAEAFIAYEEAMERGDDIEAMLHYAEATRLLRLAIAKATNI